MAASALLLAAPASAEPVITGTQVLGAAGSAAGGALGGPAGGFVGGLVFRNLGKVFEKKPAKLPDAQAPPKPEAHPLAAETPVEIKTIKPAGVTMSTPDPAVVQQAASVAPTGGTIQQAADVSSGAQPASGTLDGQLAAIQRGAPAPTQ